VRWRFIRCVQKGQAKGVNSAAINAEFELRWDEEHRPYAKKPDDFRGFTIEGSRTDIPTQFFDLVAPNEPLSVIKDVGVVKRNAIGFQPKYGSRPMEAKLSYTTIQRFVKIDHRPTLQEAIHHAV